MSNLVMMENFGGGGIFCKEEIKKENLEGQNGPRVTCCSGLLCTLTSQWQKRVGRGKGNRRSPTAFSSLAFGTPVSQHQKHLRKGAAGRSPCYLWYPHLCRVHKACQPPGLDLCSPGRRVLNPLQVDIAGMPEKTGPPLREDMVAWGRFWKMGWGKKKQKRETYQEETNRSCVNNG